MEVCNRLYNDAKVYVDFAHTPDALKNILISTNKFFKRKTSLVFGCGGNRDKSKRLIMGKIANLFAKDVYITDDNPRDEDPEKIRSSLIITVS